MPKDMCDLCGNETFVYKDKYDVNTNQEYIRVYCKKCITLCKDLIELRKDTKNIELEERLYNQMMKRVICFND